MPRLHMLRVLLAREFKRLKKNPSALLMLGLLTAVAVLMATSRPAKELGPPKAEAFWLVYDKETPWITHLKEHALTNPPVHVVSRESINNLDRNGRAIFPPMHCGVEIAHKMVKDREVVVVAAQFFGKSPDILFPFWNWFWPEVAQFQSPDLQFMPRNVPVGAARAVALEDTPLSELVKTELVGAVLLLIVMFFTCCHLQVSFTSQDRERGTLAALVLSPARISEILLAKYIFHLLMSLIGCGAVVALMQPSALLSPVLWLVVLIGSVGLLSVGTCIATLSKTQASAALLGLCYMLGGAVVFYLSSKFSAFMLLRKAAFENYSFSLLYHSLKGPISVMQATGLSTMAVIVIVWTIVARTTFFRFGWR